MLGLLSWSEGRKIILKRMQLLGMPVVQVDVPYGGRWEKYCLDRAARKLAGHGLRRVLVPKGFDQWDIISRRGLGRVDPLPLYRAVADRLVLAQLRREGVQAQRACVALRGECVDAELARTARLLCPRVRSLLVQVDRGGERLNRELYWEFGAGAALRMAADVAVRFGGEGAPGELVLCGRPELLGLELRAPQLMLPEELEPVPVLAALWQTQRLNMEQLCVTAK